MPQAAVAVAVKIGAAVAAKFTVSAVATAAFKVAALYGLNKVIANQNRPRSQGGLITLAINPDEPRRLQIGKRMNAGVLVDWYVKGSKNNQLFMVIYLGEGPMGQVTRVFSGGRPVHSTPLVHATRTVIPGFRSTEGGAAGDRLWITYYDGRPGQTADSTLAGASVGWSSNHIGTGCAYAIVECLWDSDNLRTPPSLAFEMEGAKFYDRRLDTTAGGSGSHRIDNPATWALTDNPAVALDHYLLGRYLGDVKVFGVGLDPDDVPYARQAALANLCDEDVTLKAGGTQKRYRANGFLFADRSYADTIRDLCRAMNARPADFGGRIGIIDSEERTPVLTIYDGDVIESVAEQYSPKRSWGELVSVVRGTFQDPLQNYQAAEYPRVTDDDWVTADGGSPKEATLDLEMETDAERAQRLAYLYAVRERRQAQLTGTYGLRMIELEQGDWFIRSGGIFGEEGKIFEVIDRALDVASMTVTLTAFEVDPADAAWDENIASDAPPAPIGSEDLLQAMEVPAITATGVTVEGETAAVPGIEVAWTAPTDPRALQIALEATPALGGAPATATVDIGTCSAVLAPLMDGTDYLVRARYIGQFSPSAWCEEVAVTTPGTYRVKEAATAIDAAIGSALDGALSAAELARQQISELILSLQVRIDETRENLGKLGKIDGVPVGTAIRKVQQEIVENGVALTQVIDVVAARVDDAESAIVSEQMARSAADEAEAIARQLIDARLQNAEGSITSERQARVAADEALAQDLISVDARLSGVESGQTGTAQALSGLTSRVRANERELVSQSSSITGLTNRITDAESNLTGQSTAVAALTSRVRTAENSVSTLSNSVTQLGGEVQGLSNQYSGVADALNLIQAAIVSAGGSISVDLSEITSLSSQVAGLAGQLSGQSSAINSLTSRVSATEGQINTVAQQFTSLSAGVGDLQAQVDIIAAATGTNTGALETYFAIRGVAGSSEFEIAGLAGGGAPSKVRLRADQIELSGDVVINGSLTTTKLATNAVTERKLYTGASATLPSNAAFADILAGTVPTAGGTVEIEFECDFACPSTVGLRVEFVVGSTVVRTVNFYCVGPFTHTVQAFARFSGFANNSTLTIRAKAQQSEGVGRAGCTVSNVTARSVELKR